MTEFANYQQQSELTKAERDAITEDEELRLVAMSEGVNISIEEFKLVKDVDRAITIFDNVYQRMFIIRRDSGIRVPSALTDLDRKSISKIRLKYKKMVGKD